MLEPISVFMVDDHPAIREGLKTIIGNHQAEPRLVISGEAGTAGEARLALTRTKADVILTDISLPDGNGFDLIRSLGPSCPDSRFLILSMHLNAEYVIEALQAGARGYLTKTAASQDLIRGILAVHQGDYYLDPRSLGLLCQRLGALPSSPLRNADPLYSSLTDRERQVFARLVEGRSLKEIASDSRLSVKTIENHKAALMKKLNVENLIDLYELAERMGIRKPPAVR